MPLLTESFMLDIFPLLSLLALLLCLWMMRGKWVLRHDSQQSQKMLAERESWKGLAMQASRQSQSLTDSLAIFHYSGLSIKNDMKHGLINLTVDRPMDVMGPVSGKVRKMVPGDVMTMNEEAFLAWTKQNQDPWTQRFTNIQQSLSPNRCGYCGTKQSMGKTHCPSCGAGY